MAKKVITTDQPIELPAMNITDAEIFLVSDSPLISHKWSEKSKKEIRDKQQKKAKTAKDIRNPEAEFKDSLYHIEGGGYGFPAVAFKAAAVNAFYPIFLKFLQSVYPLVLFH